MKLYGSFLWIGFSDLKATEPVRGYSLLFTAQSLGVPGTYLLNLERWKDEFTLEPHNGFEPGFPGRFSMWQLEPQLFASPYRIPPLFCWGVGGGGLNLQPSFQDGGGGRLDRTSTFRGVLLGKRGMTFFRRGVAIFTHKKIKIWNI